MAVSLGTRISGLLVVGAVAVAVTAFSSDGRGTPDSGGGSGSIVTAGPSNGATPGSPTPRQSPAGEAPGTPLPSSQGHTRTATPSPSGASPSNRPLLSTTWLPPGPVSPNADTTPDPSSVYDRLRDPGQCGGVRKVIPTASADPEWRLLHALATACLAAQGKGGSWATATKEYASLAGQAATCKGRAAYAVLGGLLDFHRQHPEAAVQLKAASGGTPACTYRIAGVDTGSDGKAQPGDTITIELRGIFFDPVELLRFGTVFVGGQQTAGPPVLRSQTGDTLVLTAVVPPLNGLSNSVCGTAAPHRGAGNCATSHNGAADDHTADVIVRYGNTEARLENAFTVVAPTAVSSPPPEAPAPSGTPQGMLPLGPLPAHPAGP
ncbi:hypothetical protein AB0N07_19360 [Streptomyces sp. NPDC051172]|uniref:hypothetical protein n=1 Tax=Streptomyces sp. NPDC051172 TaxID=3155796 RepID=UPI00341E306E